MLQRRKISNLVLKKDQSNRVDIKKKSVIICEICGKKKLSCLCYCHKDAKVQSFLIRGKKIKYKAHKVYRKVHKEKSVLICVICGQKKLQSC